MRLKPKGNFPDLGVISESLCFWCSFKKETQTLFQVQVYFVLVCFTLLHFAAFAGHLFLQIEGLWHQYHFSNTICLLCVFVSHICNSHTVSHFFIIILFVVISDL